MKSIILITFTIVVALVVAQLTTGAKGLGSYLQNDDDMSITEPAVAAVALSVDGPYKGP